MDEKELEKLWGAMSKEFNVGDFQQFKTKMTSSEDRKKFYDAISNEGMDLGDYNEYEKRLGGVKKKVGTVNLDASSLEAGNALQDGALNSTTNTTDEVFDPFVEVKRSNELANKKNTISILGSGDPMMMGTSTQQEVPDENSITESNKIRGKLKINNIDPDEFYNEIKDIPDNGYSKISKNELLEDRTENNPLYQRKIARLKWKTGIEDTLKKGLDDGNITPNEYTNLVGGMESSLKNMGTGSFDSQRQKVNSVANVIKLYGGENKDKLLSEYANEVSKVYGNSWLNGYEDTFKNSPESKYLNQNALLGYQYLHDISPEKAEQYKRLFIGAKTLKDKPDEQKGYNHLMQQLEETGINLQANAINEELNSLNNTSKKNGGLTPEQLEKANTLEKKKSELLKQNDELDSKYPDIVSNKIDDAVQEILGQNTNWFEYAMGKGGQAIKHTGQGIWEAVSSPFMSDESNTMRELSIMGHNIDEEGTYHKTDKNKALLNDKLVIQPELQKQIDAIVNNSVISKKQKQGDLYKLLAENKDKFGRVPITNGKFNVSPSSILYGVTDIGTTLLPFIGLEAITGGGATAGVARKFLSTFTAAAATSFHDEYANALMEGKPQSEAYKEAMGITAINSFAMAGAGTPQAIRQMAGLKTSAGQIINKMTDAEIEKALTKTPKAIKVLGKDIQPLLEGAANRLKATPNMVKEGLVGGAKFEGAMTGAKELQHQIYNTPIDREQNFKQSILGIINFGILGAGLGHAGYKKPTDLQKSSFLETGKNEAEYIERARQMQKEGNLTPQEFEQVKSNIENAASAYKNLPKVNAKGKPLTEKEKSDYVYNEAVKQSATKQQLPQRQKEKAEHTALVSDFKNDLILEPKTDKQLESRKNQLEKILEPQKDDNGKLIELNPKIEKESKAELEVVKDAIENKEPEFVDTKLSEPVEGLDEQGIPIGDNVPEPTNTKGKDVVVDENVVDKISKNDLSKEYIIVPFVKNKASIKDAYSVDKITDKLEKENMVISKQEFDQYVNEQLPKQKQAIESAIARLDKMKGISKQVADYLGVNEDNISQAQTGSTYFKYTDKNGIDYKIRVSDHSAGVRADIDKRNGAKTITIFDNDPNPIETLKKSITEQSIFTKPQVNENIPNTEKTKTSGIPKQAEGEGIANEEVDKVEQPTEKAKLEIEPEHIEPEIKDGVYVDPKRTILSHRGLQEVSTEFGLEDVMPRDRVSDAKVHKDADLIVKDWADKGEYSNNIEDLIKKAEDGKAFNVEERLIMQQHLANVREQTSKIKSEFGINSKEYDVQLGKLERLKEAGEKVRSTAGAALRIGGIASVPDNTLEGWMNQKKESASVDTLTEKQKEEVQKMHEDYEKKNQESDDKLAKATEEISKLKAELELTKIKDRKYVIRKKGREALQKERTEIIDSIKNKLKKVRGETNITILPYANELFAIAPDVKRLVRNLVETGTSKLQDVVDKVFDVIKDSIDWVTKKDVQDIIAGEYNEKMPPKKELERNLEELRIEAKLINKLEALLNGEEPKSERAKIERNKNITDLRKKIKDLEIEKRQAAKTPVEKKSEEDIALETIKKRNESEINKIEDRIKNKEFETEKKIPIDENVLLKKANPKLYKETMDAIVAKNEAKNKFDLAKRKDELNKRGIGRKLLDFGSKLVSTSKSIMAGIDDSVTFVQLGMAILANPKSAGKAKWQALQDAVSNKRFKRELAALHNSPYWNTIKLSGLDITEPKSFDKEKLEETFSGNLLDKNFKIKGKEFNVWTKTGGVFERLFTSMGNNMRLNMFLKRMEMLQNDGKTFDSHPQEYKDAARVINELTGRGKMNTNVASANPIVTPIIWAPRMLSSSFNLLGINDLVSAPMSKEIRQKVGTQGLYRTLTKSQRNYAFSQMAKGIGMGVAVGTALVMNGWDFDADPRSATFGTVKKGTKSYNVFGRYSQIVKNIVQLVGGIKKSGDNTVDLDKRGRAEVLSKFFRGKMTPFAGEVSDYILNSKKNSFTKKPINLSSLPNDLITPMSIKEMQKGLEQDGTISLLTRFLPAFEGIQVSDERDFDNNSESAIEEKAKEELAKEKKEMDKTPEQRKEEEKEKYEKSIEAAKRKEAIEKKKAELRKQETE